MLTLKNAYDFYRMPEDQRDALVGKLFREHGRDGVYAVVHLAEGEFNYGVRHGLLIITEIRRDREGEKWFKVGVVSPDDLDLDLEFQGPDTAIRQEVIAFLRAKPHRHATYRGVLAQIRDHFNAGIIG